MRETTVKMPVITMVAMTRAMVGAGAALLLGDKLNEKQRKAAGWSLFLVGAATTVPLAMIVLGASRPARKPIGKWAF
jgi:uncharacterized membrane protein YhhN